MKNSQSPGVTRAAATRERGRIGEEAAALGLELWFEAFADRCYDDDGKLLARSKPGAVHTREKMLAQVQQGSGLHLPADAGAAGQLDGEAGIVGRPFR